MSPLAKVHPVAEPVAEMLRPPLGGSAERIDRDLGMIFCFGIHLEGVRRRGHVTDLEHDLEVNRAGRTVRHRLTRSQSR